MRAMPGYQKLQVSSRFRAEGSGSRKLRVQEVFTELPWIVAKLQEVGILPTLVYFPF